MGLENRDLSDFEKRLANRELPQRHCGLRRRRDSLLAPSRNPHIPAFRRAWTSLRKTSAYKTVMS
jgi:hypothetical protein